MTERSQTVRSLLVGGVALVVGAAIGAAVMHAVDHHRRAWTEAGGQWVRLPSQTPAGPLPQTFTTPAKAWDYGATTRTLPATVTERTPVIVRVDVGEVAGPVGVSLAKPDGSALISKEAVAPVGAGPVSLYFRRATPGEIAVLVRNYDGEGRAGAATVSDIRYAVEADLSQKDIGMMNKAGLH